MIVRRGRDTAPRPVGPSRLFAWAGRTRYYFPSTGAAAVSPGFDTGYEDTSIATRLRTVTTKISSAMTTVDFTDLDTTDRDVLFRQYVGDPLVAQTINAQDVRLQMRGIETLGINNMFLTWVLKIVSNDGSTVRGILVAIRRDGTELDTVLTNRGDLATIASLAILDGDRPVIEIGTGGIPTVSVHSSSLRIGDADATDLPEDDTTTADNNPWLEFQQILQFQVEILQSSSSPWQNRGQFAPLLAQ